MSHQGFEPTSHHLNWGTERSPGSSTPPPDQRGSHRFLEIAGLSVVSLALIGVMFAPVITDLSNFAKSQTMKDPNSPVGLEIRCVDASNRFQRGFSVRLVEDETVPREPATYTVFHRLDGRVYSNPLLIRAEKGEFFLRATRTPGDLTGRGRPLPNGQVFFTTSGYQADMLLYSGEVEATELDGLTPLLEAPVDSQFCSK